MEFGYRYDTETGLYYLQSRYYNPDWGRFINADGIAGQTGELLSHNMFAYCKNNPINMSDPSGYMPRWAKWAITAAIVVSVVAVVVLAPEVAVMAAELGGASELAAQEAMNAAEEVAPKVQQTAEELVNTNTIRYTQDSIGRTFGKTTEHAGETIEKTIHGLKSGSITADDIPPIRIFEKAGKIFSLDNRRLYCFKQAQQAVRTVWATAEEVAQDAWKFNPINDGWDIRVRGR